jgi:hypothetical protein
MKVNAALAEETSRKPRRLRRHSPEPVVAKLLLAREAEAVARAGAGAPPVARFRCDAVRVGAACPIDAARPTRPRVPDILLTKLVNGLGRWEELASDLLAIAAACDQVATVRTPYGVKYVVKGQIGRKSHRTAGVLAVWIVEAGRPPRLVTAYPDEES